MDSYRKLRDADVCLGIRIRGSGQITTFLSHSTGFWWLLLVWELTPNRNHTIPDRFEYGNSKGF